MPSRLCLCLRSRLLRCAWCALCLLLFAGCGRAAGGTPTVSPWETLTPHGQVAIPTPALTPPPGWSAILPGIQLTTTSTHGGLAASAARPGRVIGCAMRTPLNQPATPPTFVLSDDSGKTWQTRAIPDLPPAHGCFVFADTLQQDTFVMLPDTQGGPLFFTLDAGVTWKALSLPPLTFPIGLTGGQLVAIADRSNRSRGSLMQVALSAGSWRSIAQALPPSGWDPYAAAVDVDNPAIIYLSGVSGTTTAIYRTLDGGTSWQVVETLPSAHRIALFTAHQHRVFAEQLDSFDSDHPLFYSADGGATWHGIAMHRKAGGEALWVSAQGRVITETYIDAQTDTLYTLDLARGTFATLGTYQLGSGPTVAVVVDGPAPALLYATPDHIWRLPLST